MLNSLIKYTHCSTGSKVLMGSEQLNKHTVLYGVHVLLKQNLGLGYHCGVGIFKLYCIYLSVLCV